MKDNPKTIFIAFYQGYPARYLLRSDIFPTLKRAGARIVILTPNAGEEYFQREFGGNGVFIEKLEVEKCQEYIDNSRVQTFLAMIRDHTLGRAQEVESVRLKRNLLMWAWKGPRLARMFLGVIFYLLDRAAYFRKGLIFAESKLYVGDFHKALFDKYRPDLVLVTGVTTKHTAETFLLREAKARKVKTANIILSWDNPTTKGMAGAVPDFSVAWTEMMKQELIKHHDLKPESVYVGGIAHFDIYFKPWNLMSRSELCAKYGLDPDKAIIVFGTKSPTTYPYNEDIAEMIAEAVEGRGIKSPAQLLIRLHPLHWKTDPAGAFETFRALEKLFPFIRLSIPPMQSDTLLYDMPKSDMSDLASILLHASVVVNIFSTLTIEACILDRPVVHIAFDGKSAAPKHPRQSVQWDMSQTHNQALMDAQGARLAKNPGELIELINAYMDWPNLDEAGRRRIVEVGCGPADGRSGERIARHLLSLLGVGLEHEWHIDDGSVSRDQLRRNQFKEEDLAVDA